MNCKIKLKAVTDCPIPDITAFIVEIKQSDGTVLETLTEQSTASSVTGVSFTPATAGGLPAIEVDNNAVTEDLNVNFKSFSTACGTTELNDSVDVAKSTGVPASNTTRSGCAVWESFKHTTWDSRKPADQNIAMVLIDADGQLRGFGPTGGTAGINPAAGTVGDRNVAAMTPAILNNQTWTDNLGSKLPNIVAYLPGEKWKYVNLVSAGVNAGVVLGITESNKLYLWGSIIAQNSLAGDVWQDEMPIYSGRTSVVDPKEILVPWEVPVPAGETGWEVAYLRDDSPLSMSIFAKTTSGNWYTWGKSRKDLAGLALPSLTQTGTASVSQPTPVEFPYTVAQKNGDCGAPVIQSNSTGNIVLADDGSLHIHATLTTRQSGQTPAPAVNNTTRLTLPNGVKVVEFQWSTVTSSAGFYAIGDDGQLYFWGSELDPINGTANVSSPGTGTVGVPVPLGPTVPAGTTFKSLQVGPRSGEAVGSDGRVYGWAKEFPLTLFDIPENQNVDCIYHSSADTYIWRRTDGISYIWNPSTPTIANSPNWGTDKSGSLTLPSNVQEWISGYNTQSPINQSAGRTGGEDTYPVPLTCTQYS